MFRPNLTRTSIASLLDHVPTTNHQRLIMIKNAFTALNEMHEIRERYRFSRVF